MAGEAIDRATRYADAGEDGVARRTDMLCREGRDGSVEDDAEPARIDLPAHDVETVGPQMLTGALDARQTTLSRAHDAGRRAIAEQSGRHHVGAGELVHAEGRGADLDGDHQHGRARPGARQAVGDGEPGHAAGAAQPEHRYALAVAAKTHAARHTALDPGP